MLKLNGVAVASPLPYKPSIMDLHSEKSGRTVSGRMIIYRIATKRKLELEWRNLTKAQASQILNQVKDIYCNAEYDDPLSGTTTKRFYVSDRNAEWSERRDICNSLSFSLTEV